MLFLPPNKLYVNPISSKILVAIFSIVLLASCSATKKSASTKATPAKNKTTTKATIPVNRTTTATGKAKVFIKPLKIDREEFVAYAKTFKGTPYKYGSVTPKDGLDCSGFVMVVFKHFNINPPRVTRDYVNEGETISMKDAKLGDIILFTGSDNASGIIGHMAIIISNINGVTQFIHSASGKNIGVIESKLSGYWLTHFVKVIKILE